jgi:hypothetical protein
MTEIQQRIAIAEVCGFKAQTDRHKPMWITPNGKTLITMPEHLPDYPNDLNAMHEAEKHIMDESSIDYYGLLVKYSCPWHASAAVRAKAFLKTLNLWKQ